MINKAIKFFEEEIVRLRKAPEINGCEMTPEWKEMLQIYNTAVEALRKQIPKKPKTLNYGLLIEYGWKYECPNCGCAIGDNKNLAFAYGEYLEPYEDYCCSCGQALDWSDVI